MGWLPRGPCLDSDRTFTCRLSKGSIVSAKRGRRPRRRPRLSNGRTFLESGSNIARFPGAQGCRRGGLSGPGLAGLSWVLFARHNRGPQVRAYEENGSGRTGTLFIGVVSGQKNVPPEWGYRRDGIHCISAHDLSRSGVFGSAAMQPKFDVHGR